MIFVSCIGRFVRRGRGNILTLLKGFSLLCFLYLAGCATAPEKLLSDVIVDVTVAEPEKMRFQGRGAGAGVMLSGAMGPMGIAIGVAIDEGIAKEINASAIQEGFDLRNATKKAVQRALIRFAPLLPSSQLEALEKIMVSVEYYGFKTWHLGDDSVIPEIKLNVAAKGADTTMAYPDMWEDKESLTYLAFGESKSDGQLVVSAFDDALEKSLFESFKILFL